MNAAPLRFRRRFRWAHLKAAALFILFALVTAGVAVAVAAVLEGR